MLVKNPQQLVINVMDKFESNLPSESEGAVREQSWFKELSECALKDQEAHGNKILRHTNIVASHKVYEFYVSVSVLDDF